MDGEHGLRQQTFGAVQEFVGCKDKSDRMIADQGLFSVCRNVLGDHSTIFRQVSSEPSERLLFAKLVVHPMIYQEVDTQIDIRSMCVLLRWRQRRKT